jgi:hypothetical protein
MRLASLNKFRMSPKHTVSSEISIPFSLGAEEAGEIGVIWWCISRGVADPPNASVSEIAITVAPSPSFLHPSSPPGSRTISNYFSFVEFIDEYPWLHRRCVRVFRTKCGSTFSPVYLSIRFGIQPAPCAPSSTTFLRPSPKKPLSKAVNVNYDTTFPIEILSSQNHYITFPIRVPFNNVF